MIKLHIGAGTNYLRNWCNVDLPGQKTFLASERPDLVDKYITDENNYYGRHAAKTIDDLRQGPLEQEYVCDRYGSYHFLPCADGSANEVLARHSFEHLSITEARKALAEINRVMAVGGILRLDVPDHEETLRLLVETKDSFYVRHLLGPRRNDFGFHCMSYTPVRLNNLVKEYGFEYLGAEDNIHLYPAFCLRFKKV